MTELYCYRLCDRFVCFLDRFDFLSLLFTYFDFLPPFLGEEGVNHVAGLIIENSSFGFCGNCCDCGNVLLL